MEEKNKIWHFLEGYLTENKQQLFKDVLKYRTHHFTIAAEDTFDEKNASALVRTAECLGIQNVHIINNGVGDKYKIFRGIVKGSHKWTDINLYTNQENNTQTCIDTLRSQGYQIVATTPHQNDCLLADFDISRQSAFFFGTEQFGLSDTVISQADAFLKIPIYGFTESYNISVSAAIILYDLLQRLHQSTLSWQLSEEEQLDLKIKWAMKCVRNSKPLLNHFLANN